MKMQNFRFLGLAGAIVFMSAIGMNHSQAADTPAHSHFTAASEITEAPLQGELSGISEEKGRRLMSKYLQIKDAHVASDSETASRLAGEMAAIMDGNENGKAAKEIQADAKKIAGTTDLDQQRDHFKGLTANMYKLAKTVDVQEGALYYQHCPMAFNNQGGSWLSAEKEVRNPYYGDKMLKCGAVKETIQ